MLRLITLMLIFIPSQAFAACDVYGNCDEIEDDKPLFAVPRDKPDEKPRQFEAGRTITGNVNGESVFLHTNLAGGVSGVIGNDIVSTHSDSNGNMNGFIGNNAVNLRQQNDGSLQGMVGNDFVRCDNDGLGSLNCR